MQKYELLFLGLLKLQRQHGYQINEFIEQNLDRVASIKRPTAYAILDRLHRDGFLQVETEQEGNRPPRKVYSITRLGETEFFRLLRLNLAQHKRDDFPLNIGILFIDHLPNEEIVTHLREWLAQIDAEIAMQEQTPKHEGILGVTLLLEHRSVLLTAERLWVEGLIERLGKE